MIRNVLIAILVVTSVGLAAPQGAHSDTKGKKIALSNSTDGDPWRQAMLKSWERVSVQAVKDGIIKETAVYPSAEKQVAEQEAQIRSLIQQGYDAIVVNAASRDGLNGVIKEACDAGIVVVSFDGIVSEPCAWRLSVDFKAMGKAQIEYLKEALPDGGNLLEIRGLAGTEIDDAIHAGIAEGLQENPQFKIIG
jgi:ribose transport system substrate-binding protein